MNRKNKDLNQPLAYGDFQEFTQELTKGVGEIIAVTVKEEIRPIEERFDKKITDFKDEILTSHDQISKKLDIVLTEQAATNGNVDQYRDETKDHNQRIKRLEAHAGIKPATA